MENELKTLKQEFSLFINSPIRFKAFIFFLQRVCNKEQANLHDIQQRKLFNLYGGSILQKRIKDSVINLSKCNIPPPIIDIMSLGLNCHVKQKVDIHKKTVAVEQLYHNIVRYKSDNIVSVENDEQLRAELKVFGMRQYGTY